MKNLKKLPVICSMGGLNSAGRTSGNMAYKRLIFQNLSGQDKKDVLKDLMSLSKENKTDQEILDLLHELMQDHKDQSNLKKIESLEQKLINNLDENSYSELIKLKSQINRD